jgi:hypothetical protein
MKIRDYLISPADKQRLLPSLKCAVLQLGLCFREQNLAEARVPQTEAGPSDGGEDNREDDVEERCFRTDVGGDGSAKVPSQ